MANVFFDRFGCLDFFEIFVFGDFLANVIFIGGVAVCRCVFDIAVVAPDFVLFQ